MSRWQNIDVRKKEPSNTKHNTYGDTIQEVTMPAAPHLSDTFNRLCHTLTVFFVFQ
jgi:hypothetical protein